MIGPFQIISPQAKTLCFRKIQAILIKIKMNLFIVGKRAGDFFDSFEFSFIQFDAFAFHRSHAIRPVSL
jgi:hypothetical protein